MKVFQFCFLKIRDPRKPVTESSAITTSTLIIPLPVILSAACPAVEGASGSEPLSFTDIAEITGKSAFCLPDSFPNNSSITSAELLTGGTIEDFRAFSIVSFSPEGAVMTKCENP